MAEPRSLWMFFILCFSFIGIILFCVVFGGYTSFYRSQGRIETATTILTDACQKRLGLIPGLIETAKKAHIPPEVTNKISHTAEKAQIVLKSIISQKPPHEKNLMKEFENSQTALTIQLKGLLMQPALLKISTGGYRDLKNQLDSAQDNLFVIRKRYNQETAYFNVRTKAFPSFIFAKLFGFDKIEYPEISKDTFLPARKAFAVNQEQTPSQKG